MTDEKKTHSPGPWRVAEDPQAPLFVVRDSDDRCVAELFDNEADAHLIAVAPEMLAFLQRVAEGEIEVYTTKEQDDELRLLIRKARGEG